MPYLSTNTYSLELCVTSLHRGHAKRFKFLTCHQKGAMLHFFKKKKQYVRVILAQRAMQFFSVQKKKPAIFFPVEEKGSPILCGRLFRDIRTFGRAVEGSSVSPPNTMGGLSGGRLGSDTSGASSASSFIISRLRARALA